MFLMGQFTGNVVPAVSQRLYLAQIDPHLTSGCEVVLDVSLAHVWELELVQLKFWQRALGLSARCLCFVLFTKTGLMPVIICHIFTFSYLIISYRDLSYQPTDCFIIGFVIDHTPFHYRSRTHVGHTPNTWMTSYMPIPHGLPIVYTPPTLVAHIVVSVLLLTCSYHSYLMVSRTSSIQHWIKGVELSLAEICMDKEFQIQTY